MKYEWPWSFTGRFIPYSISPAKLNLKLEDKILLGIGGIFLIGIFLFVSVMGTFFDVLSPPTKKLASLKAAQESEILKEELEDSFEKAFKETEESFERLHEAFEESRRKRDELFKKAQQNFEKRFAKAQADFRKGGRIDRIHKRVEEAGKKARKEALKKYPDLKDLNP